MPIACTATYADDEPWRIERLGEVVQAIDSSRSLCGGIVGLHDHKGTLYVNFNARPATQQVVAVAKIWADLNELHLNVYENGLPLTSDVLGFNPFGGPES
jgi:hypothetical protein